MPAAAAAAAGLLPHTHTHFQHYLIFLNIILKWFYIRVFMEMEESFKPI